MMDMETQSEAHPDDLALAAAMKARLARSREKGRGGWDDKMLCRGEYLATLLLEHIGEDKEGAFDNVTNFAMMLHQRGESPELLANIAGGRPKNNVNRKD